MTTDDHDDGDNFRLMSRGSYYHRKSCRVLLVVVNRLMKQHDLILVYMTCTVKILLPTYLCK